MAGLRPNFFGWTGPGVLATVMRTCEFSFDGKVEVSAFPWRDLATVMRTHEFPFDGKVEVSAFPWWDLATVMRTREFSFDGKVEVSAFPWRDLATVMRTHEFSFDGKEEVSAFPWNHDFFQIWSITLWTAYTSRLKMDSTKLVKIFSGMLRVTD